MRKSSASTFNKAPGPSGRRSSRLERGPSAGDRAVPVRTPRDVAKSPLSRKAPTPKQTPRQAPAGSRTFEAIPKAGRAGRWGRPSSIGSPKTRWTASPQREEDPEVAVPAIGPEQAADASPYRVRDVPSTAPQSPSAHSPAMFLDAPTILMPDVVYTSENAPQTKEILRVLEPQLPAGVISKSTLQLYLSGSMYHDVADLLQFDSRGVLSFNDLEVQLDDIYAHDLQAPLLAASMVPQVAEVPAAPVAEVQSFSETVATLVEPVVEALPSPPLPQEAAPEALEVSVEAGRPHALEPVSPSQALLLENEHLRQEVERQRLQIEALLSQAVSSEARDEEGVLRSPMVVVASESPRPARYLRTLSPTVNGQRRTWSPQARPLPQEGRHDLVAHALPSDSRVREVPVLAGSASGVARVSHYPFPQVMTPTLLMPAPSSFSGLPRPEALVLGPVQNGR